MRWPSGVEPGRWVRYGGDACWARASLTAREYTRPFRKNHGVRHRFCGLSFSPSPANHARMRSLRRKTDTSKSGRCRGFSVAHHAPSALTPFAHKRWCFALCHLTRLTIPLYTYTYFLHLLTASMPAHRCCRHVYLPQKYGLGAATED